MVLETDGTLSVIPASTAGDRSALIDATGATGATDGSDGSDPGDGNDPGDAGR